MNDLINSVLIIGNGISGVTAARHIRKNSDIDITIISNETPYFFSRTALMYIYMGHMKFVDTKPYEDSFWKKNRINLVFDQVTSIDEETNSVKLANNNRISYEYLIIACGSKPNKFGWPGQELEGVSGMYHLQDLERLEALTSTINEGVIVGGGLIGIELAEMLQSRGVQVHYLVRESNFWNKVLPYEESKMVTQHILDHGVDLQLNTELNLIEPNSENRVKGVYTSKGEFIDCQYVGLTCGVSPNIDFLKESNSRIKTDKGIIVNQFLQTNIENIYAIGDCAQHLHPFDQRSRIESVWYTGRMMGETVARTITGTKTAYQPGHWFNSAKFFDIEYQTYGRVNAKPSPNEIHLYWEHPKKNISIRLAYDRITHKILGVLNMGVRLRHEVFDQWLNEKREILSVIEHFENSNFDPEFYANYTRMAKPTFYKHYEEIEKSELKRIL